MEPPTTSQQPTTRGHGSCGSSYLNHMQSLLSNVQFKEVLYGLALIALLVAALTRRLLRSYKNGTDDNKTSSGPFTPTNPSGGKGSSSSSSSSTREPGKWTPSTFRLPTPPPYPNWSITDTQPLPYRPFRHGPKYFITMGLRNESHENWIELDNNYPRYHADKARRITERGHKCCRTAPDAFPAAVEFLEELVDYLCARYPSLYRRTETGIANLWSGETLNIVERPLKEDPMALAGRLVQDDLALMVEKPDGQYYLLAGSILLPGFWRLEDKFGMPLSEIHTSGDVPGFESKLERGMMNFFRRLKPEEMVARNNYFIQVDDDLAWSHSIGLEDSTDVSWDTATKDAAAIEHHHFRSERQTLRRLPRTGAVVFTIRTYFHPVTELAREDYVPGRLASAVRSWGDDVSRYKGRQKYENVLLDFLDRKHREQVERGLDLEREDDTRQYPY